MNGLDAKASFWRKLAYAGARFGPEFFVRLSPPVIGALFGAMLPRERRAVVNNLRRMYGRRGSWIEARDTLRTFANFGCCLTEALASGRPAAKRARCRVHGQHRLSHVLGEGRGLVLVTAHTGPWDAAAHLLAQRLFSRVMLVMQPEAHGEARRLHDSVRHAGGVAVAHIGEDALDALPVLRHLRSGGVVAMQLDRLLSPRRAIQTELLGAPFFMPAGPFELSALARVPLLSIFAKRVGYFDYELTVGEAFRLEDRKDRQKLEWVAQQTALELERFLRQNPTQWFHFTGD